MSSATAPPADTKPCPACGETIKASALKCRFCGEDVEAFAKRREAAEERTLFEGRPATLYTLGQWVLAFLTVGIAWIVFRLDRASTHYRITSQRIQIERGLLSKSRNNVELFRIDDYELLRPLGMRIVGHSALVLKSSDRNAPDLVLRGIRELPELAETLRECTLRERERRGVRVWADA